MPNWYIKGGLIHLALRYQDIMPIMDDSLKMLGNIHVRLFSRVAAMALLSSANEIFPMQLEHPCIMLYTCSLRGLAGIFGLLLLDMLVTLRTSSDITVV
jgi:hypothetical protein